MKKHFSKMALAIVLALVMALAFAGVAIAEPRGPIDYDDETITILSSTPLADTNFSIRKYVPHDFGTELPDMTFWFSVTQVVPTGGTGAADWTFGLRDPDATRPGEVTIPYQRIDIPADLVDGSAYRAQTDPGFDLGGITWPHAGQFFFVIQEVPDTNPDIDNDPRQSLIYDTTSYLMIVTVINWEDENGNEVLRISNIQIALLGNDNAPIYTPGTDGTPGEWSDGDEWWCFVRKLYDYRPGEYTPGEPGEPGTWTTRPSCIHFTNPYAYNRPGNDIGNDIGNDVNLEDARLSISKTVVGNNRPYADLTTPFTFDATLTIGAVTVQAHLSGNDFVLPETITAAVQEQDAAGNWVNVTPFTTVIFTRNDIGAPGPITGITYTSPLPVGGPGGGFQLTDGQRLRFPDNVPSGTTVLATERALENWSVDSVYWYCIGRNDTPPVPGRAITTNPAAPGVNQAVTADSATLTPPGVVTTTGDEKMNFNNAYDWSPIMGLFIGSMPFMVALLVATVLLAMMVASRSRQRIEQLPIAY